ncbi:serine/threonine-protein kinase [Cystobacter fuscus]|uniref:serine/threonine-protein kinase n=1 Tax=Cystobacter fuscus TaxID=43 RepID=UPI00138B01F0|nr:serine/threonine-protein kinase [Cystobacter fuscus]
MSETCPRCGAPVDVERLAVCASCLLGEDRAGPERIGALELEEEIGRGGMGQVFRARHVRLDRPVAVKFLIGEAASSPEAQARFAREARALALLDHPHIVRVHDFGEEEGERYLVMELVEGRGLSELLPLPPAEAVRVALQVCDALAYAHARGVVHRDIKPANILVDGDGRVKVTDFGIARIVRSEGRRDTLTAVHTVVGTPEYMAPEALAGAAPDPRMDVYAVGVLLHEMVTGRPLTAGSPTLTGALGTMVRRAVALDPTRRYASAHALGLDLRRLADGAAEAALPPDEAVWLRTVALLQAVACALVLWALVVSVTPRVLAPEQLDLLTMQPVARLADGRWVTKARFETGPILGAVAGLAVALAAYGLLRRHWRQEGLDAPAPELPLREARVFLGVASVNSTLFALHLGLAWSAGLSLPHFMPLLGGLLELGTLYLLCVAVLEAWRRQRALSREPWLWWGVVLMLLPPAIELGLQLHAWRP